MTRGTAAALVGLAALVLGGDALGKKPKKEKELAPPAAPAAMTVPADDGARAAAPLPAKAPRRGGSPAPAGGARQVVQRESHIEFDERLVQGQTAAGAIYLFQRGESEFRSMVRMPESFRDRTVRPLLPPSPSAAAQR